MTQAEELIQEAANFHPGVYLALAYIAVAHLSAVIFHRRKRSDLWAWIWPLSLPALYVADISAWLPGSLVDDATFERRFAKAKANQDKGLALIAHHRSGTGGIGPGPLFAQFGGLGFGKLTISGCGSPIQYDWAGPVAYMAGVRKVRADIEIPEGWGLFRGPDGVYRMAMWPLNDDEQGATVPA